MTTREPSLRINVDATNPGQFFACCGLLELADRLTGRAEGWFSEASEKFFIRVNNDRSPSFGDTILKNLSECALGNTMTDSQIRRHRELSSMKRAARTQDGLESEKSSLDSLYRESPLVIGAPFCLRIDWFTDSFAGGKTFKTWAGQQSVLSIAEGMKNSIGLVVQNGVRTEDWLFNTVVVDTLPFNFDSSLGDTGSARDVGFSFDPLKIDVAVRPFIEILAFIGLQRFRPSVLAQRNKFKYEIWHEPLLPENAFAVAAGKLEMVETESFEFSLLYRTKYLKSFLPATKIGVVK
jgi:CRISPR-associated protein Csb3